MENYNFNNNSLRDIYSYISTKESDLLINILIDMDNILSEYCINSDFKIDIDTLDCQELDDNAFFFNFELITQKHYISTISIEIFDKEYSVEFCYEDSSGTEFITSDVTEFMDFIMDEIL